MKTCDPYQSQCIIRRVVSNDDDPTASVEQIGDFIN